MINVNTILYQYQLNIRISFNCTYSVRYTTDVSFINVQYIVILTFFSIFTAHIP